MNEPFIYLIFFLLIFYNFCFHILTQSDIFNLPLPALWTAVLGEYNRNAESGHERRISIEKIITHSHYSHFDHDIGISFLFKSKQKTEYTTKLI